MSVPRILISNDDGFRAPGIVALAEALDTIGETWVVAPERERSASSHSLTLHKPLRVEEFAPRRYWVSGTPTDSIYVGVNHIVPGGPNVVVSGINRGANLGDDVTYSGTVGAAIEGALMGLPALAVSVQGGASAADFAAAGALAARVVLDLLAQGMPPRTLVNLNVPRGWNPDRGVRVTALGRRNYGRQVDKRLDPYGRAYYWIGGPELGFDDIEQTDCALLARGHAVITPIHLDLTDRAQMAALAGWSTLKNDA